MANQAFDMETLNKPLSRVIFYGSSDDLIEVEGKLPGCDEYNGDNGLFETCGLRIMLIFAPTGCWRICVSQIDEGVPVTAEAIGMGLHENGYSMFLELLVPDGSYVTKISN